MTWRKRIAVWSVLLAALTGGAVVLHALLSGPSSPPTDLGIGMKQVRIAPGEFIMGARSDRPVVAGDSPRTSRVWIAEAFYMGACEVTVAQWRQVMGGRPPGDDADLPVTGVSWSEATEFCRRLSRRTGYRVRLPSEDQWEYACRAGTTSDYAFGDALDRSQANFGRELGMAGSGSAPAGPRPVGAGPANAWGLHDMHGNVWEWCRDGCSPPPQRPVELGEDPNRPAGRQEFRVARGGSWLSGPGDCRSASREGYLIDTRSRAIGFRVVVEYP